LLPLHRATKAKGTGKEGEKKKIYQSICSYDVSFIPGTKRARSLVTGSKGKGNKQNLISIMQEYQWS